ncbi:MAG: GIDE domain-containing protein [Steroidobacteraceae bacterium]
MSPHGPSLPGFWLLAALGAAATLYSGWQFFRFLRRDRFSADTPVAKIRSAAQGYVHLEGTLAPSPEDGELIAPLTRRRCVWWDYKVEQRSTGGRGSSWSVRERATSVSSFVLRDADGECLVGPVGADITPTTHNVWHGSTPLPDTPPAASVQSLGSAELPYRYTERLLTGGARVTVLGDLRSHSGVESIDEDVRATLAEWKQHPAELLQRFDRNHDGTLDMTEWEAARSAARAQVQAHAGAPESRRSVVGQPTHGQPFLIAPFDGAQLVRRTQRMAALAFAATLVLAGLTAWCVQRAVVGGPAPTAGAAAIRASN